MKLSSSIGGWLASSALVIATLPLLPGGVGGPGESPLAIGSRRELFVDRYLIDTMRGTYLRPNHPVDAGSVLAFDQAWEGLYSAGYSSVVKDGPIYRLFYRGMPAGPDFGPTVYTCYADSSDGIHWRKPDLELFGRTNIILGRPAAPQIVSAEENLTVFLDARPGVPQIERYKGLGGGFDGKDEGYYALTSEDGIHWRLLQEHAVISRQNYPVPYVDTSATPCFWSEAEGCYVAYMRTWSDGGLRDGNGADYNEEVYPPSGHLRIRSVGRLTSPDFIHWSKVQMMTYGDTRPEQLYSNTTMPYFRAPQIYINLIPRIVFDRPVISPEQVADIALSYPFAYDASEIVFMTSRSRSHVYDRAFLEAYVRNGIGPEHWTSRDHYPTVNVVPTGPTEMSFYTDANLAQPTNHLERFVLTTDRFASVYAPFGGGEFTTRPLVFAGRTLLVNYSTSVAGGIRVEIQDAAGRPIPGFGLEDSIERVGNEIERPMAWKSGAIAVRRGWTGEPDNRRNIVATVWKGGEDIGRLAGTTIRLHFVMKEADLYALRFR
jgi:hypothetical protein